VFANFNLAHPGEAIVQPAPLDGGFYPRDWVGTLVGYVPLSFGGGIANHVDAAVAKTVIPGGAGNYIHELGTISGVAPSATILPGNKVRKVGRSSGLTKGEIVATHATVKVDYWAVGSIGQNTLFDDQIITTMMGVFGDSGSLLVDPENRAVGILFAGSATHTYFNDMRWVMRLLGVHL
jgi:hypothetical protein